MLYSRLIGVVAVIVSSAVSACRRFAPQSVLPAAGLVLALLSACDEVQNVAPQDEVSNEGSAFLSDDDFAPRIVKIEPYEHCRLRADGNPSPGTCDLDVADTKIFGEGIVRVVFTFDKPVYFDLATHADIELNNADLLDPAVNSSLFVPLAETVDDDGQKEWRELEEDEIDNSKPYTRFTAKRSGSAEPVNDGEFTIGIPAGKFYALNANGRRVYNNQGAKIALIFDNSSPSATVYFSLEEMNSPTKLMSPLTREDKNYSRITMYVDWGKTVTPSENLSNLEDVFEFRCIGCVGGAAPYNGGRSPLDPNGSGVKYLGTNQATEARPANSLYRFELVETDLGANGFMTVLNNALSVDFIVKEGSFIDLAGNTSQAFTHSVKVDSIPPEIDDIQIAVVGTKAPAGSVNGAQRVLNAGDLIEFTLIYSEDVQILSSSSSRYSVDFYIGTELKSAGLTDAELLLLGTHKKSWTFAYEIETADGDDRVNSSVNPEDKLDIPGDQYSGSNTADASTDTSWTSDIGLGISIRENAEDGVAAVDRVGLSRTEEDAARTIPLTSFPDGGQLNHLHVDGRKPYIDTNPQTTKIIPFSQLLSGEFGVSSNSVRKDEKLVVAIPFNEVLVNPLNLDGIEFTNENFRNAAVDVLFCDDYNVLTLANCNVASGTISTATLVFDDELTQRARDFTADADFNQYKYRTLIFSRKITEEFSGIKSVLVQGINLPGIGLDTYSDIAGNTFDESDVRATVFVLGEPLSLPMVIEGGVYGLSSFQLLDKSTDASEDIYNIAYIPEGESRVYNRANPNLYIEARLTAPTSGVPSGNDAVMVLSLMASGVEIDVSSDSVGLVNGDRSRLLFSFNLIGRNASPVEDFDGITIKEIVARNPSSLADLDGVDLALSFLPNQVSSQISRRSYVDTKQPVCDSFILTNNPNGAAPSSTPIWFGTRVGGGYAKSLYLALKCDQEISFVAIDDAADITPFIPVDFGGIGGVFRYYSATASGPVFRMPIQTGFKHGNGTLKAGVRGQKIVNWHFLYGTREGDNPTDHKFFADRGGNPPDLTSLSLTGDGFLLEESLSSPDNPGSGIVVDTRPYPIAIGWPQLSDFSSDYYTSSGKVYVTGAPGSNKFTFSIDYGRSLATVKSTPLLAPLSGQYEISGRLLDAIGNEIGTFVPTAINGNRITFTATLPYGNLIDRAVRDLELQFSDYTSDINNLPFAHGNVSSTNPVTLATTDSTVDVPITRELRNANFDTFITNVAELPNILFNTSRPQLTAIELYYDKHGDGVTTLNDTSNNDTSYGDFYVALVFDKDMSETGLENSYIDMQIRRAGGNIDISPDAISFVPRSSLSGIFNTVVDRDKLSTKRLFYKFVFGKTAYVGIGVIISPTPTDALVLDKTGAVQQPLRDIYNNELDQSNNNTASFPVALAGSTAIKSLSFDQSLYHYGDTIVVDITTDQALDTSGLDNVNLLALPLRVSLHEGGNNAQNTTILARGTNMVVDNSDSNGAHILSFSYPLSGLAAQFDSDTENQIGLTPVTNLLLCADASATNCPTWNVNNRDSGLRAVLNLDGYTNLARVASRLSLLVATNRDLLGSGVVNRLQYVPSGGTTDRRPVNPVNILGTGDTLYFYFSPELLDISPDTLRGAADNSLKGTTNSKLRFSLYNAITQTREDREAAFDSLAVSNRQLVFRYVIVDGDLVHLQDANLSPISYTDADGDIQATGAAQSLSVEGNNLFTNLTNSNELQGITDELYGNPVWGRVVEASGDYYVDVTDSLSLSASHIQIDTRPRIESISSDTTGDFSKGQSLQFTTTFSKDISIIGDTDDIKARLKLGGTNVDATADFHATVSGNSIRFELSAIPSGVDSGVARLERLVLLDTVAIRYNNNGVDTNMNANLATPLDNVLEGINIDSNEPRFTGATLNSEEGGYGVGTAVLNKILVFALSLNKPLTEAPAAGDLKLELNLANTAGGSSTVELPARDDSTANSIIFAVDVENKLPSDIEHYFADGDRLEVANSLQVRNSSTKTFQDSAGNNLILSLDRSSDLDPSKRIYQQIAALEVNIDTNPPSITDLTFDHTASSNAASITASKQTQCVTANEHCIKGGETVDLRVTYNEKIVFSNSSGSNFQLAMTRAGGNLVANAQIEGGALSQRTDKTTDYRITLREEILDTDGIEVDNYTILPGSHIRDRVGNDLRVGDILSTLGSTSISTIKLDSVPPNFDNGSFTGGQYGNGSKIKLTLSYSEALDISGDNIAIKVRFQTVQNTTVERDFRYDAASSNPNQGSLVFSYEIGSADAVAYTSAQYLSPVNLNGGTITDLYGNPAMISFADGAVDSDVEVTPSVSSTILNIKAQKNGIDVSTDYTAPTYFDVGDELKFQIIYSDVVNIATGTVRDENEIKIRFNFGDSSGASGEREAVYTSGLGSKTLEFSYTIEAGDEDRDGIQVLSNKIEGISENLNKLVRDGTASTLAAIVISKAFANDLRTSFGTNGQDDVLETILVNTLNPPNLVAANFINISGFDTDTGTTQLQITWPADRGEDITQYMVQLFSGSTTYTANTPTNVDIGSNSIFATPDANNRLITLAIPRAMVAATCDQIQARVWAVDEGNKISANSVTTSSSVYFNDVRPTLIGAQSASGNADTVSFSHVDKFPTLTAPTMSSNCSNDSGGQVLFAISYDDAGTTKYLVPKDYTADDASTHYARISDYLALTSAEEDKLVPFRDYTTTFIARDSSGLDSTSSSHSWKAFAQDLPIHYDAADVANLELSGDSVVRWTNIGTGESHVGTVTSNDAEAFNLRPVTTGTHNNYLNSAPDYSSTDGAVVFPRSNTNRANLFFDLDDNITDNNNNRHIQVASGQTGFTIFVALSLPDTGVSSSGQISTGFHSSDDLKTQLPLYLASGSYAGDNNHTNLEAFNGSGLFALYNPAALPNAVVDGNNANRYPRLGAEVRIGTKNVLVYQLHRESAGSENYALCRYVGKRLLDDANCATDYRLVFDNMDSGGWDKLYLGAVATSGAGNNTDVRLLGSNSHNLRLYQLGIYNRIIDTAARESLTEHLVDKWDIPLVPANDNYNNQQLEVAFFRSNEALDNQLPVGSLAHGLECFAGADSTAEVQFPSIFIKNIPVLANLTEPRLHVLLEQTIAGSKSGPYTYMQLVNLDMPTGTASSIVGSNDGNGAFAMSFNGVNLTSQQIVQSFTGLCNQFDNEYRVAAYVTDGDINKPNAAQTIAAFEQNFKNHIKHKSIATLVRQYTLDNIFPPRFGYSVRKLFSAYNGPAITVQRDLDGDKVMDPEDTTEDINFTGPNLDEEGLINFVTNSGADPSADAYVVRWFDQSGNGFHLDPKVGGSYNRIPRIVNNGVVEKEGGRVALWFNHTESISLPTTLIADVNINTLNMSFIAVLRYKKAALDNGPAGKRFLVIHNGNPYDRQMFFYTTYLNQPTLEFGGGYRLPLSNCWNLSPSPLVAAGLPIDMYHDDNMLRIFSFTENSLREEVYGRNFYRHAERIGSLQGCVFTATTVEVGGLTDPNYFLNHVGPIQEIVFFDQNKPALLDRVRKSTNYYFKIYQDLE